MNTMNRRNFLSNVALVGAAVPALKAIQGPAGGARDGETVPSQSTGALTHDVSEGSYEVVTTVGSTQGDETVTTPVVPFYEDRLRLLTVRGLMAPCPNCTATGAWTSVSRSDGTLIECGGCGWRDIAKHYESRCPCLDCRDSSWHWHDKSEAIDAIESHVLRDAPPRLYRIVDSWQTGSVIVAPVTRKVLNAYDASNDRIIHHAVQHRFARVICALRALHEHYQRTGFVGFDRHRQPNGNLVLLSWVLMDSYEQQVDRGERKPVLYQRDGETGRITLVQGVKA